MDEFSYLSVLISVILGLAVTQILKGFRGILLSRTRIRIYWPVIAWAALLLLICVQSWWAMFELRHYHPWTFAAFAVVLLQTIVTYMLAGLVFPDLFGEGIVDLRESFYAHRVWFFALGFLAILVSIGKVAVLYGELPRPTDLAFHAFFGTIFLIGALTRRESCHKALVVLGMASFILYIVIVLRGFIRLREGVASGTRRWGRVSAVDSNGRTIWIADAHRDDCPALASPSIWSHGLDRSNLSSERLKLCC